jgi:hypothetical protein
MPDVPSMAEPDLPEPPSETIGGSGRPPPVDRQAVQYLDRVRAIFRPSRRDALAPGLESFIGREEIFRHVGTIDLEPDGTQPMMQVPSYWPGEVSWVAIRDLEILEILDDQDVRAG